MVDRPHRHSERIKFDGAKFCMGCSFDIRRPVKPGISLCVLLMLAFPFSSILYSIFHYQ
jgi:hypothetical protein